MINKFKIGDKKFYSKTVKTTDLAEFETGIVHQVYGTFALGRDAEWVCRLFVLEMKEEDEEGIGVHLDIKHSSPALINSEVNFMAEIIELDRNFINCQWECRVNDRLIASGTQGQKIIKKDKLEQLFSSLKNG